MKNPTHVASSISSPEAINNMADDGDDRTFDWNWIESVPIISSPEAFLADDGGGVSFDFTDYLMSQAFPDLVPAGNESMWNFGVAEGMSNFGVEGGMWNFGVVEGTEKNWVVEESMGKIAAESMVRPAGSNSHISPFGLMDQRPASNEEYGGFMFHGVQSSSFAVEVSGRAGPEWMVVGGAPPPGSMKKRTPSAWIPTGSGGSDDGYSGFPSQVLQSVVGVEAPREILNLGNKRAAEWMGSAPPGPRASKRQRSLSGSIETSGGSGDDEAMGNDFYHEAAVVAALEYTEEPECWWIKVCGSPGYTDADFKRDFHMRRSTFDTLCNMLDASVRKKDTARTPVPVCTRVAVCVFRLATGEEDEDLRGIAKRFGIAHTTCHKIIHEVVDAINTVVQPGYVSARWPDGANAMADAAEKFKALTGGIPGIIGAVYTTHFRVLAPKNHVFEYLNRRLTERRGRKSTYSVTLHAAVDADGAFTNLCVGNPGGMSDEKIFSLSSMSEKHAVDQMVVQGKRLVGGAGYPLTDWTLVPYTHSNLTLSQRKFNNKVALARGVAFDAFRRLKARWAFLQRRTVEKNLRYISLEYFSSVMKACCVLHNLCERNGDVLGDELRGFQLEDEEMVLVDNPVRSYGAAQVRDEIAHNLFHGSNHGSAQPTK